MSQTELSPTNEHHPNRVYFTLRYDTRERCYFNVRSKADIIQLNLTVKSVMHFAILHVSDVDASGPVILYRTSFGT